MGEGREPVRCRLKTGGDGAARNSRSAIEAPVFRAGGAGACARCTSRKGDWGKRDVVAKARRRNYAYQVTANHRHLKTVTRGKYNGPDLRCPEKGCGVLVTAELDAATVKKYADATEEEQAGMTRTFAASHSAALEGRVPNDCVDNRSRAGSMLHRRMSAAGNNMLATVLRRPFDLKVRQKANAILKKQKFKFPEKKGKRAPIISGPDARALHSDPELLVPLIEVFYEEELKEKKEAREALEKLRAAANGAANIQAEAAAAAAAGRRTTQAKRPAGTAAPPAPAAPPASAAPQATAAAQTAPRRSRKRKADDDDEEVTVGGQAADADDVQQYRDRRRTASRGTPSASASGSASAPPPSAESATAE
eukprot:1403670-Prymnesium_polylepis.1